MRIIPIQIYPSVIVPSCLAGHGIDILNIEDLNVSQVPGRRMIRGKTPCMTNLHRYRAEVYLIKCVIDL